MSRVLTILMLCTAIIACPFICRASGTCCGGAEKLTTTSDCCCSETERENDGPIKLPAPCEKQCLCSGALVADSNVQILQPELSSLEFVPTSQPRITAGSSTDRVDNLRLNTCRNICCLNVRLLI